MADAGGSGGGQVDWLLLDVLADAAADGDGGGPGGGLNAWQAVDTLLGESNASSAMWIAAALVLCASCGEKYVRSILGASAALCAATALAVQVLHAKPAQSLAGPRLSTDRLLFQPLGMA